MAENEELQEKKKIKLLLSLMVVLLAIIVAIVIFYVRANQPMVQARKEAIAIAQKSAHLKSADHFYWFTRQKTYFSVTGKDDKGTEVAVIIPKSGEKITVLNQQDGITEAQARSTVAAAQPQDEVIKATLGLYEDRPVWEVMTKNSQKEVTYYLLSFDKGETIKEIQNV